MIVTIPSVVALGTCRVHHPLNKLENEDEIKIIQIPKNQFVHNTDEIIQRIGYLQNKHNYPKELLKYIFENPEGIHSSPNNFDEACTVIIEISSAKKVSFGRYHLQMNRIIEEISNDKSNDIKKWMVKMRKKTNNGQKIVLTEGAVIDNNIFKMLNQFNLSIQNKQELKEAFLNILTILDKKIIFVNHIDLPKTNGVSLKSRDDLCSSIRELSEEIGFELFEPSEIISKYGREKMLKNKGADLNHYSEFGEEKISSNLLDIILKMSILENKAV